MIKAGQGVERARASITGAPKSLGLCTRTHSVLHDHFVFHRRVLNFLFDLCFLGGCQISKMPHPQNSAPHVVRRMSLPECGHCGVADSMGDDEVDLGVGELLDAACELGHGRIEVCFKPIAAAGVETVTSRAVRLVLCPCRLESVSGRYDRICAGACAAM